jgi:hypothetical protein
MTEWKEENKRKEKDCTKEKERAAFDGTFDNYTNKIQRKKRDLQNLLLSRVAVPVLLFCRYKERSHTKEDEPEPLLLLNRSVHTARRFGPPQKQSLHRYVCNLIF